MDQRDKEARKGQGRKRKQKISVSLVLPQNSASHMMSPLYNKTKRINDLLNANYTSYQRVVFEVEDQCQTALHHFCDM